MTKNELIAFYKQRITSTKKIINTLYDLQKTNLTTRLIECELEMQRGELEFFTETFFYLKSRNSVEISDDQRKIFREELQKAHTEALKQKIDPEKVIKGEPVIVKHFGLI